MVDSVLAEYDSRYWLEVCRSAACERIKVAELGGDGQDIPFEQAFSNLAHAYLRDKAPTLLDHEQGFQLLDRNQDNTKSVGVFGFKVGSHQLFAPVFFLQGDLKGHELLYLKNQDMFVPMKENWINYILNRKPHILGDSVGRNTGQLGVQQPDLNRLSQSPYKYASAMPPWSRQFMPKYASLCIDEAFPKAVREYEEHCQARLDLGHFLKQASLPALEALVSHCQRFPAVGQKIAEYHGLDVVRDAIKSAGLRACGAGSVLDESAPQRHRQPVITGSVLKQADDQANQKIKVIRYDASQVDGPPEGLDEDDQEALLREKVLIKDHRDGDEVSVPYNVQVEKKLFNPHETGLYEVLVKPGKFERCFIVVNPHGPNGRKSFATVARVGDEANWLNCHPSNLWVTSQIEGEDYDSWFDGLTEANSLSQGGGRCILVGPRGEATLPFRVEKEHGDEEGTTVYEVDFSTYCEIGPSRLGLSDSFDPDTDFHNDYSPWRDGARVHLNGKEGTRLRSNRGDLYVPKGFKKLSVTKAASDKDKDDDPCCGTIGGDSGSETPPIRPGNLLDAELAVMVKTASLKIAHDGSSVFLNNSHPQSPMEALIGLVAVHGFREDIARQMIKTADVRRAKNQGALQVRVKYAMGAPYLTEQGPGAPTFPEAQYSGGPNMMGYPGRTQDPMEMELNVQEMSARNTDPSVYDIRPEATPAPMDQNVIADAAATGQKEVFDTAMIGSMLKAVRDDTMIDRYLPDLIKGMDRIGRILFMFYWHGDKFAERYGKQDMPELEDSLRNAFEMMGDVILFLKQKTVEPYPEEDVRDLDLGESGGI